MISRGLDTSTWSYGARREWDSLTREQNPELYQSGLLALGQRLRRQDRLEAALQVFHLLQQDKETSSAIAAKAGREIDAIEGRGAVGARVEFLLDRFAQETANPALLFGMGAASAVFNLSRAVLLGRLLTSSASLATRGLGARALAGATAFALEAPTFVAASHGARWALGEKISGPSSIGKELAGAYLTLGGLRLFGLGGEQALRLTGGNALARAAIPELSAYLGILAGKGLEHWTGLRKISSGDTWLLDSLTTLLQFRVGGELSNRLLGSRWSRFQQELNTAAETSSPIPQGRDLALEGLGFAGVPEARASEIFSTKPYAIQGRDRSGIWSNQGAASGSANLNIKWVPEGLPCLEVAESLSSVDAVTSALENHLRKIRPSSVEIHYQGRMIQVREQDQLKERVRRMIEEPMVPEGFLAAVAFLKGSPKIAMIFTKENGKMRDKFTTIDINKSSLSSPSLGAATTSSARRVTRFEEIREQLRDILQVRNPKVYFEGVWNIRDQWSLAQMLENAGSLPEGQSFTIVLRQQSAQVVFEWNVEGGVKRVAWKTQPLDRSELNLSFPAPTPTTSEARERTEPARSPTSPPFPATKERTSDPSISTPLPSDSPAGRSISCQDINAALEAFSGLLSERENSPFQTPPIEIREGNLDESYLGILAEILHGQPLPEGRKISLKWLARPGGMLKIQNDNGKTTAEFRRSDQPIKTYLLKPDFASQMKRFVLSR